MYDIIVGRSEEDKKKFGTKGTVFLGKHYVQMGRTTSLANKIYLDVSKSHVVFVCGKRGSGKCLTGDTLITLDSGQEVPIKDLKQNNSKIFGLDKHFKLSATNKQGFYERTVNDLISITLRSGRKIELTPEHPLLTVEGWKDAQSLTIGSRIATARHLRCVESEKMSESKVKLLAYLITEGHTKRNVLFSNMDSKIVKDFETALTDLHPDLVLTPMQEGCYAISSKNIPRKVLRYNINRNIKGQITKGSSITHEKTHMRIFLEKYGLRGLGATQKSIPKEIFGLHIDLIKLFLNRLFSCDGSVYKSQKNLKYWGVSYSTSSETLSKQVQSLLLRCGILSRCREKFMAYKGEKRLTFEIVLDGQNVIKFIKEIGFFGVKQTKQLIALKEMEQIKRNSNIDTIPKEIWNHYRPKNWGDIGKQLGYANPKSSRSSINYAPSRQKLLQIAKADNHLGLQQIAESDIFWDEILSIEKKEGTFQVYDISVPSVHNFVANNIIVHNSWTMGVLAEGISDLPKEVKENISVIMLDTMGIYWTMKYPNKKDKLLLNDWDMKEKGLDVQIFTPIQYHKEYKKKNIPTDFPFSIRPSELSAANWCLTFEISITSPIGVLIEKTIHILQETDKSYSIADIVAEVVKDKDSEKVIRNAVKNLFMNAGRWGLFDKKGTELKELAIPGQVTVLDVSCYATMENGWNIKNLVIGLISEKLFIQRMIARKNEESKEIDKSMNYFGKDSVKQEFPLVWLIIDEAHEFLPVKGKTLATDPLVTILREGRQPGISLILATQQPGKIHTDVMTQSDTVIAHRITAKLDVDALGALMQSYMREGLVQQLDHLPRVKGSGIIFDDNNEKMYPLRVRPRFTWHGGGEPRALKDEEQFKL